MISTIFVASGSQPAYDNLGKMVGNAATNPFISLELPFIPTLYSFSVFAFLYDNERDLASIKTIGFEVATPSGKIVQNLLLNTDVPKEEKPATTFNFAFNLDNIELKELGIYTVHFSIDGERINKTQFNVSIKDD